VRRSAQRPPCKGGWHFAPQNDWGIPAVRSSWHCHFCCSCRRIPSSFVSLNHLPEGELAEGQERPVWTVSREAFGAAQYAKGPLAKGAGILLRKMTGGFLQCVSDGSAILAAAAVESLRFRFAQPPPFSREALGCGAARHRLPCL